MTAGRPAREDEDAPAALITILETRCPTHRAW